MLCYAVGIFERFYHLLRKKWRRCQDEQIKHYEDEEGAQV